MSIFVDTGAWFASVVPADRHHLQVISFLKENSLPLVTTDYVIDETLTLLRARGEVTKAVALGRQLLDLGSEIPFTSLPRYFPKPGRHFAKIPHGNGVSPIAPARLSWSSGT